MSRSPAIRRSPSVRRFAPHCRGDAGGPVDVLLGHTLYMALDPKQVARMRPYPPLGTLYAASILRRAGLRVALFDAMLAPGPEAFEAALEASRPRLVALFEDSFNFLSKMCLSRMREAGFEMLRATRARGLPCLVAGSDASDRPELWLEAGATAVLTGEAEWSLLEAVQSLPIAERGPVEWPARSAEEARKSAEGPAWQRIAGSVTIGTDGALLRGPARPPARNLEGFPLPARDLVDMEAYRRRWRRAHGHFQLNLAASRGCPYACNWCARPIWGRRYAQRRPESVAEEVARIATEQAPDGLWFVDDVLGLQADWVREFADALEALGLRLPYVAQSRVDRVDEDYAEQLARSGCEELWLGVESGSQAILDAMQKGIRVDQVEGATRTLRAQGIRVAFFLQLGYPGEGWADIEATAELMRRCLPDAIGVSVSYPLPGTPFHARVAEQLGARRHWRDSQDLAMLFQGSYRSGFYRELHALLHREHEALLRRRELIEAVPTAEEGGRSGSRSWRAQEASRAELRAIGDRWREMARRERAERSEQPTRLGAAQGGAG